MTIEQIYDGDYTKPKPKNIVGSVTDQTLENFENIVRLPTKNFDINKAA